ncbi:MAG: aminoglycoside phosphotransferase family protein [Acidobacteriia bacterium]|nr:aminoglycoside phosphotransferase family protein [Terriglobia bacterium]
MRFFAKTFLVDSYPSGLRFVAPWEEGCWVEDRTRPAGDQIEVEWAMTQALRELAGPQEVPRLLGKSDSARTIVWEQASGRRLDQLVKWSRWADPSGTSLARAFLQAGRWLRKVHQTGFQRRAWLSSPEIVRSVQQAIDQRGLRNSRYGTIASRIVADAVSATGEAQVEVPIVFAHGDFCPANLLWDGLRQELRVIDFEHAGYRSISHDLITFLYNLRLHMLNPLVPKSVVVRAEQAFWQGYDPVPRTLRLIVSGVATARIFCYYLPRVARHRRGQGWERSLTARLFNRFFEANVVTQRLGIPRAVWNPS